MSSPAGAPRIRRILESDRIWSAYALADLELEEPAHCRWLAGERAVILIYSGLEPPVLFAHGPEDECLSLLAGAPAGRYVFTLLASLRQRLGKRLHAIHEVDMWRMVAAGAPAPGSAQAGCLRLGPSDLPALQALFDDHPDRPDSFHPRQLETGVFMGAPGDSGLTAVAGTHILAPRLRLAAIGNVFTHPAQRGRGLAGRTTSAVISALAAAGFETFVLNVAQANAAAVRCYHRLGFREHCAYREGLADLLAES